MINYPFRTEALKVVQPLGTYYAVVLPAELLLDVCFSDAVHATSTDVGTYTLSGTQRRMDKTRLSSIAKFMARSDAAVANSLILAANSRAEDGFIEENESSRWRIEEERERHLLVIPERKKLSSVIDGQHRLFSFAQVSSDRLSMPLLCSVFFDLPMPYQAMLFATINSTQRPVDKSLTYELFGFNIAEEAASLWSPEKVAVALARKLNTERESPLADRITIAPENHFQGPLVDGKWRVSMATVVEGILKLISTNPKQDNNYLLSDGQKKRDELERSGRLDRSPLRKIYLNGDDQLLFIIVRNFLSACNILFWKPAQAGSFIRKTVGVQALFDVLKVIAADVVREKNGSIEFFVRLLGPAQGLDFSAQEFRNASGAGRSEIRRSIVDRINAQ